MAYYLFYVTLLTLSLVSCEGDHIFSDKKEQLINVLAKEHNMRRLHLVCDFENVVQKRTFFRDKIIKISTTLDPRDKSLLYQNVLVCADDQITLSDLFDLLSQQRSAAVGYDWVIMGSKPIINDLQKQIKLALNQQVYFLDLDSGEMTEFYTVKDKQVKTVVSKILLDEKKKASTVTYLKMTPDGFLSRRSDLHGVTLRAVTEVFHPYVVIDVARDLRASDDGWNVTDEAGDKMRLVDRADMAGTYVDILDSMQRANMMNFSAQYYLRKDGAWGWFVNGTWRGMVANLMRGEADFTATATMVVPARHRIMDFLQPLDEDR